MRSKRRVFSCRFSVISLGVVAAALLLAVATGRAAAAPSAPDISQQLDGKDATQIAEAVATIQEQLQAATVEDRRAAVQQLARNGHWLKKLLDAQQYDQVVDLAIRGTIALPSDVALIEYLQWYQIKALLKLNKPQSALAVAKGLFNVCRQQNTANELSLIVDCLKAAYPGDATIIDRLRVEQTSGSVQPTPPITLNSVNNTRAGAQRSTLNVQPTVLDGIKIDGSPYAEAIQQYSTGTDYESLVALGNLLLLSDLASDALPVFKQAYAVAGDDHLAEATESIARCLRAQDGTIGRANAWVMSIRPK